MTCTILMTIAISLCMYVLSGLYGSFLQDACIHGGIFASLSWAWRYLAWVAVAPVMMIAGASESGSRSSSPKAKEMQLVWVQVVDSFNCHSTVWLCGKQLWRAQCHWVLPSVLLPSWQLVESVGGWRVSIELQVPVVISTRLSVGTAINVIE